VCCRQIPHLQSAQLHWAQTRAKQRQDHRFLEDRPAAATRPRQVGPIPNIPHKTPLFIFGQVLVRAQAAPRRSSPPPACLPIPTDLYSGRSHIQRFLARCSKVFRAFYPKDSKVVNLILDLIIVVICLGIRFGSLHNGSGSARLVCSILEATFMALDDLQNRTSRLIRQIRPDRQDPMQSRIVWCAVLSFNCAGFCAARFSNPRFCINMPMGSIPFVSILLSCKDLRSFPPPGKAAVSKPSRQVALRTREGSVPFRLALAR